MQYVIQGIDHEYVMVDFICMGLVLSNYNIYV